MRKDILPFYRALGLSPGAEAIDIRRAYRQMIQQWHPDLFKPGSPMQTTAEDITKEINEAYEQLYRKKLYRNFLPKSERKDDPLTPGSPKSAAEPQKASRSQRPKTSPTRAARVRPSINWAGLRARLARITSSAWTRWAFGAGAAISLVLAVRVWIASADFGDNGTRVRAAEDVVPAKASRSESHAPVPTSVPDPVNAAQTLDPALVQFEPAAVFSFRSASEADHRLVMDRVGALLDVIEIGDTRSRVREIQGVPDEVSDTLYRYGSSVVYFKEGRVAAWRNRLPRLRVRDWTAAALPTLDRFALGSSRSDVVRAQGLPASFDDTSYTYGSSVINFQQGRVSGWSEGDVRLQDFQMPVLPFVDLDRLQLWEDRAL